MVKSPFFWFGGEVAADEAFEFGADAFDGVLAGGILAEGLGDVLGVQAVGWPAPRYRRLAIAHGMIKTGEQTT